MFLLHPFAQSLLKVAFNFPTLSCCQFLGFLTTLNWGWQACETTCRQGVLSRHGFGMFWYSESFQVVIYQQVAVQSIGRYGRYGRCGRWARRSDRSGATDICSLEVCRNAIEGTGQSLWPKAQEMMEMSLRLMGLGTEWSGCVRLSLKKTHISKSTSLQTCSSQKRSHKLQGSWRAYTSSAAPRI